MIEFITWIGIKDGAVTDIATPDCTPCLLLKKFEYYIVDTHKETLYQNDDNPTELPQVGTCIGKVDNSVPMSETRRLVNNSILTLARRIAENRTHAAFNNMFLVVND